jgi:ApaG protein
MNKYQFKISVTTQYLPEQSNPEGKQYVFAYTVNITNKGSMAAQLISRHWIIEDDDGDKHEVKGLGVVGHQPLLGPDQSFEYTSGTPLTTSTGTMSGSYFFVAEDGERFDVPVPEFFLSTPRTLH